MHSDTAIRPYFVVLFGPTGVGKSDVAITLAEHLPCEIVNIDVGQFYVPLSIGTAKPDWQNQKVTHHLFDILDQPVDCTVVAYRELFERTIKDIWQRNKVPLVVGGSCFYVHALFFPPHIGASADEKACKDYQPDQLWQKLNEIDPLRAQKIHPHDTYRIKRALAIWHATGKKPSVFVPAYEPPADYTLICLTRDRQQLYERINKRTELMIKEGWIDEVKPLVGTEWEQFLRKKNLIGYPELFDYLEGTQPLDQIINLIQQDTRNYAKRQLTFWRRLEKQLLSQQLSPSTDIETVNLTSTNLERYIRLLSKRITSLVS